MLITCLIWFLFSQATACQITSYVSCIDQAKQGIYQNFKVNALEQNFAVEINFVWSNQNFILNLSILFNSVLFNNAWIANYTWSLIKYICSTSCNSIVYVYNSKQYKISIVYACKKNFLNINSHFFKKI